MTGGPGTSARGPAPAGRYVAASLVGDMVVTAGMTPKDDDDLLVVRGVVGGALSVEDARAAAGIAAGRAIAAVEATAARAGRTIDGAVPVDMSVFVRSAPDFTEHSAVADGASDRVASWLGGLLPARAAIGVPSLPGGAPVEVVLRVVLQAEGRTLRDRTAGGCVSGSFRHVTGR